MKNKIFLRKSGIFIPSFLRETNEYNNIKKKLTRYTKDIQTGSLIKQIFFFENKDFMVVPRNFHINTFFPDYKIQDDIKTKSINIKHNIVPRSEVQKRAIDHMLKNDNCTIELDPGVGKTVISICVLCERKLKTVILVHRDSLIEQWKNRLLQFTNINTNDISILTSTKYKECLDKDIILMTNQAFLACLRKDLSGFLSYLNECGIGTFIADEVHTTIGAETFSKCSLFIPSKYVYGLSATPYRYDGNTDIIHFHLGEVYKDDDYEGTMIPSVNFLLFDFGVNTPRRYKYLYYGGTFQRSRYLNLFHKSETYTKLCKSLIDSVKETRDIIFVAERIKFLEEMDSLISFKSKGYFYGNNGLDQLDFKLTFATPGKIRDGIDKPSKDFLIITSPVRNIKQLTGRISRNFKDKKDCIVLDLVDIGCSEMRTTIFERIKFYKSRNCKIKYMLIYQDGRKIEIDEDKAKELCNRY